MVCIVGCNHELNSTLKICGDKIVGGHIVSHHMPTLCGSQYFCWIEKSVHLEDLHPYILISLDWTLIFEWYVLWCGSKNKYLKDMSLKEIGLRAQKFDIHSRLNNQHNLEGG